MRRRILRNQHGQGLIEYLVIVALVAVGSIAIVRSLGETVYTRFANVTNALQNKQDNLQPKTISAGDYKKKGMDDFFKNGGFGAGFP